ncbi:MAG: DMT family transporter [Hyphomicrobiaceae bacterium]
MAGGEGESRAGAAAKATGPVGLSSPAVRRGTALGAIATLMWSVYGVLVISARGTPPFLAMTIVFLFSTATLLLPRLVMRRGLGGLLAIPPATLALGFLGLFGSNCFYVLALASGSNPIAVNIVSFSWPVLMAALVLLVGLARPTWWDGLAVVAGFLGVSVVTWRGEAIAIDPGLVLAFGGALSWALYSGLRRLVPAGPEDSMAAFVATSMVAAFAMHLLTETTVAIPALDLLALAAVGILPVGAANLLWDHGARTGDPVLLAAISFIEPIISTFLVAIVLGLSVGGNDLVGIGLVLSGIALSMAGERRRRRLGRDAEVATEA